MWPLTLLVDGRPVMLVTGRNDPLRPAVDLDELRTTGVPGWDGDAARLATRAPTERRRRWRPEDKARIHSNSITAEKHYNQAGSLEASRRHQAMLRKLRQDLDEET